MNVHLYCPLSSSKSADVHSKFQLRLQRYFQKHPGGQDILLGVVGRDATVEFETMRHSAIALQQLERYLGPRNLEMEGKNLIKCEGPENWWKICFFRLSQVTLESTFYSVWYFWDVVLPSGSWQSWSHPRLTELEKSMESCVISFWFYSMAFFRSSGRYIHFS